MCLYFSRSFGIFGVYMIYRFLGLGLGMNLTESQKHIASMYTQTSCVFFFHDLFMSFRWGMILFNAGRCFQSENSKTVPQNDLFDEHCIDYGSGNIVLLLLFLRLVALRVSWTGLRVVILLRLLLWYDWYVLWWKMPVNVLCWWYFLDSWATTYGWPFSCMPCFCLLISFVKYFYTGLLSAGLAFLLHMALPLGSSPCHSFESLFFCQSNLCIMKSWFALHISLIHWINWWRYEFHILPSSQILHLQVSIHRKGTYSSLPSAEGVEALHNDIFTCSHTWTPPTFNLIMMSHSESQPLRTAFLSLGNMYSTHVYINRVFHSKFLESIHEPGKNSV